MERCVIHLLQLDYIVKSNAFSINKKFRYHCTKNNISRLEGHSSSSELPAFSRPHITSY